MIEHFEKIKPKLLFALDFWDGPLSGVCEYEGELLYFALNQEVFFSYNVPYEGLESIYSSEEEFKKQGGDRGYDRLRVYNLYRIPKEYMDNIMYNYELFKKLKFLKGEYEEYRNTKRTPELPKELQNRDSMKEEGWRYVVAYTTEEDWGDTEEYYKRRYGDRK